MPCKKALKKNKKSFIITLQRVAYGVNPVDATRFLYEKKISIQFKSHLIVKRVAKRGISPAL